MAGPYDIGDEITLKGTFTGLAAPTAVTCKVKEPDGTLVDVAAVLISSSVNADGDHVTVYEGTYDPTKAGDHYYRFVGTGAAKAAGEKMFLVRAQKVL